MTTRRVNGVSRRELERRWNGVREELRSRQLDALILVGSDNLLGGYIRWFTDAPIAYRKVVIFYPDDLMTLIEHGADGEVRDFNGHHDDYPGVGQVISVAEFPSIHYSQTFEARAIVRVLKARGARSIGYVNPGAMPYALVKTVLDDLAGATFHDCTEAVDALKAVKSAEEITFIRQTAEMQDRCFERVLREVRPGMRDYEIAAMIQDEGRRQGGEGGISLAGSAAPGEPAMFQAEFKQGRTLQTGDVFSVLIENSGPGGYFLELVRPVVLGPAANDLLEAFEVVKEAQAHTLAQCRPGALFADIYRSHNEFMAKFGQPPERRLFAHGQGYDMVERPLIRDDETMSVVDGMCLTVHPSFAREGLWVTITDNYLVGSDGPTDCLHRTAKRVFEI